MALAHHRRAGKALELVERWPAIVRVALEDGKTMAESPRVTLLHRSFHASESEYR